MGRRRKDQDCLCRKMLYRREMLPRNCNNGGLRHLLLGAAAKRAGAGGVGRDKFRPRCYKEGAAATSIDSERTIGCHA